MEATLPTVETAKKLGLLPEEYDQIISILGRKPNFTELSIFSVMWSEHCSYKNSIVWLKKLPKKGPHLLAEAGEENAGLVDIGDGLACAFKIESHNHPSALEPYQGAATGVGGINRDIFTMGARPIAGLNSLRFGPLDNARNRWLVKGVVKGIGDYGNAFGIPTVGGEVYFDDCYTVNPLVNAFSAGIVEVGKTASAISYGVGNKVFIVGSATGKDGIHGATFASEDITEKSNEKLPAVQVGDPFLEKLLLEATLEVIATGHVIGIQDMGAAGIICSTSEMSAKGKHGMNINLDLVPRRQDNMEPFELLLSESQERMLVVVEQDYAHEIKDIFAKWDLHCAEIGEVIEGDVLNFFMHGELVATVPATPLVLGGGAPQYHREYKEPAYFAETKKFDASTIAQPDYADVAKYLLQHPNVVSRRWIYSQYDSMVGAANMSTNKPGDAAVVNVAGTRKALVMSVDCNGRYVHADPERGCMIAVSEAARNVVCAGGVPSAITNNLNFGNPYNPEVYWQFVGAINGMRQACEKFETPVTGGNVSFYNQSSDGGAVFPTPTIGMLGIMKDVDQQLGLGFTQEGDTILLLGKLSDDINSSEYLYGYRGVKLSPAPYVDLDEELALQRLIINLNEEKLLKSAHDCADGGLWVALVEAAMVNDLGFEVELPTDYRKDGFLFGEAQGRVVVSVAPEDVVNVKNAADSAGVPAFILGTVKAVCYSVDGDIYISKTEAADLYNNTLTRLIEQD